MESRNTAARPTTASRAAAVRARALQRAMAAVIYQPDVRISIHLGTLVVAFRERSLHTVRHRGAGEDWRQRRPDPERERHADRARSRRDVLCVLRLRRPAARRTHLGDIR